MRDEMIGVGCIVHAAAVMVQTVAHYQVAYVHDHVVTAYLVEHPLRNGYVRTLVFYNHAWTQPAVVDHRVAAARHAVELQAYFIAHESCGITQDRCQKMGEMLAHPLFGCQRDETPAKCVVYFKPATDCMTQTACTVGQVQTRKGNALGRG